MECLRTSPAPGSSLHRALAFWRDWFWATPIMSTIGKGSSAAAGFLRSTGLLHEYGLERVTA